MSDENETNKLWKIRVTLMEMCRARGYVVDDDEINLSLQGFKDKFGDRPGSGRPSRTDLNIQVFHSTDVNDQMFIFFPEDAKIGVKIIKEYCQRMKCENVKRAILVLQGGLTPSAKQAILTMAPAYVIEYFLENELVINVTKHCLVPEHIVLTPDEKMAVLKKYKLQEHQLNRILMNDPVCRFFGCKKGQVIQINRPCEDDDSEDENAEKGPTTVAYRLVV